MYSREMLLQGGSAVDGAIAALLCTSVVNPQSMGIGGGSILAIRNKTGWYDFVKLCFFLRYLFEKGQYFYLIVFVQAT